MKHNTMSRKAFTLTSIALVLSSIALISAAEIPIPKPDGKEADMSKPVQVFILMGQSNMVGLGRIDAADKTYLWGSASLLFFALMSSNI